MLSDFEGKASPVIRKLASKEQISADERSDLAIFIALAGFRTPDIVDSLKLFNSGVVGDLAKRIFSDVEQVKEQMRGKPGSPTADEELAQEAKEMVEYIQSGGYEMRTNHRWAIVMAMRMAYNVAPLLAGRSWHVIHCDSDKNSFVTTDAPVVLTTMAPRTPSIWGVGYGNPGAIVIFSLTLSCALVISGDGGDLQHQTVGTDQIRHCNLAMADRCQRFVIGREEVLVRSLADSLGLANKKWQPKLQRS